MINKELMRLLACPKCRGDVSGKEMFIVCKKCRLAYPVLDRTVPDMLIKDAWPLEKARKSGFRHREKL
jgi:uncharacterized protein YbaR (Trm112 family)